jgi:hypothetical protein
MRLAGRVGELVLGVGDELGELHRPN